MKGFSGCEKFYGRKVCSATQIPKRELPPAANTCQIYLFYIRVEGYRLYINIWRFNYLNCTLLEKKS